MPIRERISLVLVVAAGFLLLPRAAAAQSAIAGQVERHLGRYHPRCHGRGGKSSADREGADGRHRRTRLYTIVDLRQAATPSRSRWPISTVVRQGIDLPSNFTATWNAEMKVIARGTLTVSGTGADRRYRAASTTQVISRDWSTAVPTRTTSRPRRDVLGQAEHSETSAVPALVPQILTFTIRCPEHIERRRRLI